jgi:hypothetical protein
VALFYSFAFGTLVTGGIGVLARAEYLKCAVRGF